MCSWTLIVFLIFFYSVFLFTSEYKLFFFFKVEHEAGNPHLCIVFFLNVKSEKGEKGG